jgi:hypothetical protein
MRAIEKYQAINKSLLIIWSTRVLITLVFILTNAAEPSYSFPDIIYLFLLIALWMHFFKLNIPAIFIALFSMYVYSVHVYYN